MPERGFDDIAVRTLTPAEVGAAVDWAAAEGWNPGLADAATFRAADPGAFLGAFAGGDLAAVISVARQDGGHGFLGFYICRPELRGRGLGLRVWQAGMARLAGCATVGLDGVVAQQANYARSGFVLSHRNIRHAGAPRALEAATPVGVAIVAEAPSGLAAYDAAVNGHGRRAYFAAWLAQPRARLRVAMAGGRPVGWGLARPCREGHKIGPLFADDPAIATALFSALVAGLAGPVALDTPEPNAPALALARAAGLAPVFETARMYRGPAPPAEIARTWGVMSFEFG